MQAIVAPRLIHVECCPNQWNESPDDIFVNSDSRFSDIGHLAVCGSNNWHPWSASLIRSEFSGVRHLVLDDWTVTPVLLLGHWESYSHWRRLESLTICGLGSDDLNFLDHFVSWLETRSILRRPVLRVKFCSRKRRWPISSLCERLRELCLLE
ncbi:hypothetical protein EDD16DRAFT_1247140 [Pisolithus croceorrhizus]|nr:hypothetical protein EDD16DRAFT_1247140 [Pisolithus croceorrhizus]KAI6119689.1 hypothetical protein EV401DRAFT_1482271 [Pisolithus croceorrhizus]